MLTPYDRKQQAAERAQRELAHLTLCTPAYVEQIASCDWDAELAKLAPAEGGESA